jgi:hypothetical protein
MELPRVMHIRFTIAQLLRSTMFFAIGFWMVTWTWREWHGTLPEHHMLRWVMFLIPTAFGGAIGALLGKTPHGVFWGMVLFYATVLVMVVLLLIAAVIEFLL